MASIAGSMAGSPQSLLLAFGYSEPRWYAAYTSANHEKRIAMQFGQRSLEHFLPLYDSVRRWKDRRVQFLQTPGVVKLVSFNGLPAPLPDAEIEALRASLESGLRGEPHPYLQAGRRATVKSGHLQGLEGIILRRKNRTRFILSFDLIMRSVAVELDETDLTPSI